MNANRSKVNAADGRPDGPQLQMNALARYSCALDVGLSGIQDLVEGEERRERDADEMR